MLRCVPCSFKCHAWLRASVPLPVHGHCGHAKALDLALLSHVRRTLREPSYPTLPCSLHSLTGCYAVQLSPSPLSFCLSLTAARASLSLSLSLSPSFCLGSSGSNTTRGFSTNLTDPDPVPEQGKSHTTNPERKWKRRFKYRRERHSFDFPTVWCGLCSVCVSPHPFIPVSVPFQSIAFVVCRNLRLRWVKLRT